MISLNLSFYLLNMIFQSISYTPILELIILYLLSPYLDENMINFNKDPINNPSFYNFKWSFQNIWDNFEDNINRKTKKLYLEGDLSIKNSSISFDEIVKDTDLNNAIRSDTAYSKKSDIKEILIFKDNESNKFLSAIDLDKEHINMSKALGVLTDDNLSNYENVLKRSPLEMLISFKSYFVR